MKIDGLGREQQFNVLVDALKEKGVKGNVRLFRTQEISIELGWHYTDIQEEKTHETIEEIGIKNVAICAESNGIRSTKNVNIY